MSRVRSRASAGKAYPRDAPISVFFFFSSRLGLQSARLLRGFPDGSPQVPPVCVLQHERDVCGARIAHHVEEPHDVHVRDADVA